MDIRRTLLAAGAGVVALALAGCGVPTQGPTPSDPAEPTAVDTPAQIDPLAWNAPADVAAAVKAAGIRPLGDRKLKVHYHAHLDLFINDRRVTVPANIGIDEPRGLMSPLHTHDETGILHVESAEDVPFTLGQFFAEWRQPLTTSQVGPVTVEQDQRLRVYRNGKPVSGPPALLRLADREEIVIWIGPADREPSVPASYDFPDDYDTSAHDDLRGERTPGR